MATAQVGKNVLQDLLNCSICKEVWDDPYIIPCGHIFCKACLAPTVNSQNRVCPTCKAAIPKDEERRFFFYSHLRTVLESTPKGKCPTCNATDQELEYCEPAKKKLCKNCALSARASAREARMRSGKNDQNCPDADKCRDDKCTLRHPAFYCTGKSCPGKGKCRQLHRDDLDLDISILQEISKVTKVEAAKPHILTFEEKLEPERICTELFCDATCEKLHYADIVKIVEEDQKESKKKQKSSA